jgi:nucleoside-diphosphate-sugar epimerase
MAEALGGVERVVVLGANGWFGRTAVDLLESVWGIEVIRRIRPFARGAHKVRLRSGELMDVAPIVELGALEPGAHTLLVDCAYPTQEKVAELGVENYQRSVERLRQVVNGGLERLRPVACASLSSGAAVVGDEAADRTRIYGALKRTDEEQLAELCPSLGVRLCVARVYAASGPYMTKPETYALGDLISQARSGGPMRVRAEHRVIRSYALVADILEIAVRTALRADPSRPVIFETGGEEVEIGELAQRVALSVTGGELPVERPPVGDSAADRYVGDASRMMELADELGIEPLDLGAQIRETDRGV